jgi:hypothetical protein
MVKAKNLPLLVALTVAVAGIAFAQNRPVEDVVGSVARASHAGPLVLTAKETLRSIYSDSGSGGTFASCAAAGCLSPSSAIYSYNITCPAAIGRTCTYDIQIAGQVETGGNSIVAGENGLYQFLVDGAIPTGGGTDFSGYYHWQLFGPEFSTATAYSVHSQVKNSVLNQAHNITVYLACQDVIGDGAGCFASAGFQTLVIRVWTP